MNAAELLVPRDSFDGALADRVAPPLKEISEWSTSDRLAKEKLMLGYYVSGHPLDRYRDEMESFASFKTLDLQNAADGREVTVGGIIGALKSMTDKKGNLMAFVTLEDFSGSVEIILFSDCYEKHREAAQIDQMVLVTGRLSTREGEAPKIIASELLPLSKLTERFNCQLVIKISMDCTDKSIDEALALLEQFDGKVPVLLAARQNGSEVYIRSRKYTMNRLKELLGESGAYLRPLK